MLLYGNGGHAKVVSSVLEALRLPLTGIFDDRAAGLGVAVSPVVLAYDPQFEPGQEVVIAIGNNKVRQQLSARIQHPFRTLVHPQAIVDHTCTIGGGTVVFHGTVVQRNAVLGAHVIVNTRASVDHDCVIGDFVHLAPGTTLCGGVQVGEGTLVGAGATIIPGVKVGKGVVIGAGAVVTKDIPDHCMAAGVPARVIKFYKEDE